MHLIELLVSHKMGDVIVAEMYWESPISGSEDHVLYYRRNEFFIHFQVPNSKECSNEKKRWKWGRFQKIYKTLQWGSNE